MASARALLRRCFTCPYCHHPVRYIDWKQHRAFHHLPPLSS